MSTCRLKVLADIRGVLLTHPSDSLNPDMFGDGGSGRGRNAAPLLCRGYILGTSVGEELYL